jgi:hypothetical protein
MHPDFERYIGKDRLTYRKWVRGVGIFYGLVGLLFASFIVVKNHQTGRPYSAAALTATAATLAIKNDRDH